MVYLTSEKKNYRLQLMNIDLTGVDCSWISWFPGFMNGSGNGALSLQTWMYLYREKSTLHGAGSLGRSGKCLPKEKNDLVFLMKKIYSKHHGCLVVLLGPSWIHD